jgi:hypothetical protein
MRNESWGDRIVRIVLSLVIAAVCIAANLAGTLAIVLTIVSAILMLTGLIGICPLYMIFHFSTYRKKA